MCIRDSVRIRYPYALKECYLPGEFPEDQSNPTNDEKGIEHSGIQLEGKEEYNVAGDKKPEEWRLYYHQEIPKEGIENGKQGKIYLSYKKGITDDEYFDTDTYFTNSTLLRIYHGHESSFVPKIDPESPAIKFGSEVHELILTDKSHEDAKKEAARKLFNDQCWVAESNKVGRSIYESVFRGQMLGLPMQCKIDWFGRPVKEEAPLIIDLKTTPGKSGTAYYTSINKFMYYMQAYIYMEGVGANVMAFYFVHNYKRDMYAFLENMSKASGYMIVRRGDALFNKGKAAFESCVKLVKDNNYTPKSFK